MSADAADERSLKGSERLLTTLNSRSKWRLDRPLPSKRGQSWLITKTKMFRRKSTRTVRLDRSREPVESAVLAYLMVDVNQNLHGLTTITSSKAARLDDESRLGFLKRQMRGGVGARLIKWHVRCALISVVDRFTGDSANESGARRNIPGKQPYSHIQGSARLFGQVYCLKRPSMGPFQDLRDAPGSLKLDEEAPSSWHAIANLRSNQRALRAITDACLQASAASLQPPVRGALGTKCDVRDLPA